MPFNDLRFPFRTACALSGFSAPGSTSQIEAYDTARIETLGVAWRGDYVTSLVSDCMAYVSIRMLPPRLKLPLPPVLQNSMSLSLSKVWADVALFFCKLSKNAPDVTGRPVATGLSG